MASAPPQIPNPPVTPETEVWTVDQSTWSDFMGSHPVVGVDPLTNTILVVGDADDTGGNRW